MLFWWLKQRRRRRVASAPLSPQWSRVLEENVAHYGYLSPAEREKAERDLKIVVAEKNWEGCGGLAMTDEIRVTIAAQAAIMLLGFDVSALDHVATVLVYPTGYIAPASQQIGSAVLVGEDHRLGEAWQRGPVILSLANVLEDGRNPGRGHNLVWHELAHQLDMLDRTCDGTPPLPNRQAYRRWRQVMTDEYERLATHASRGRPTLLDEYGATDPAEFFAVATECFFDRPKELRERHGRLYDVLAQFYRQDPAERVPVL